MSMESRFLDQARLIYRLRSFYLLELLGKYLLLMFMYI